MGVKIGTTLPLKYSFSGSDIKGYWILPEATAGRDTQEIQSLSTISVQIYEPIGRARALGHRSVRGFASSVREIAGTMVLTVINDHPLIELINLTKNSKSGVKWSYDLDNGFGQGEAMSDDLLKAAGLGGIIEPAMKIATLIPVFDIFLHYVSEYVDNTLISEFKDWVIKDTLSAENAKKDYYALQEQVMEPLQKRKNEVNDIRKQLTRAGKRKYDEALMNDLNGVPNQGNLEFDLETDVKEKYRDDIKTLLSGADGQTQQTYTVSGGGQYGAEGVVPPNQSSVGLYIKGIKIISEGIVSSVNDMVTEMTFQFIASDVKTISRKNQMLRPNDVYMSTLVSMLRHPNTELYKMGQELEKLRSKGKFNGDLEFSMNPEGEPQIVLTDGFNTPDKLGFKIKGES